MAMTKAEIEAKWPIADIFALLLQFVNDRPLEDDSPLTKAQVINLIETTRDTALQFDTPRYDIFTMVALEVKQKYIEGNFCQHAPLLCGWGVKYAKIIQPQYDFRTAL